VNASSVCRKLGITRANYYKRRRHRQRRAVDGDLLTHLVIEERQRQPRLGTRKLQVLLRRPLEEAGVQIGRDRMFEELRKRALLVEKRRAEYAHTTNSRHGMAVFPNRIRELELKAPNQVWVADLTYLRTKESFVYLSLVTDKYSRKIVGYHCGDTLEASGCVRALDMALKDLPKDAKPIHHSDRGSQYCCEQFLERLESGGLSVSMTEKNHTAENALAERMNGILKTEYGLGGEFQTRRQARRAVEEAVYLYNCCRPHSALKLEFPATRHALAE
jgi:transposase InsO family protein